MSTTICTPFASPVKGTKPLPDHYLVQVSPGHYVRIPVKIGATQTAENRFSGPTVVYTAHRAVSFRNASFVANYLNSYHYKDMNLSPEILICVEFPMVDCYSSDNVLDGYMLFREWRIVLTSRDSAGTDDERILRELRSGVADTVLAGLKEADHPEIAALLKAPKGVKLQWLPAHPNKPNILNFGGRDCERETRPVTSCTDKLLLKRRADRARQDAQRADALRKSSEPNLKACEILDKLKTDPYLAHMVAHAARDAAQGMGRVEIFDSESEDAPDCLKVSLMTLHDVLPYLLRMGFHATRFESNDSTLKDCAFMLEFPGYAPKLVETLYAREHAILGGWDRKMLVFYGNSPTQLRHKGVVKCVPRLLGWLRSARIALTDPLADARAEAAAAAVGACDLDDGGQTASERHDAEQTSRKRKLVDAIHADEAHVEGGCRWAGIKKRLPDAKIRPMRIEAIHGDVFCFATYDGSTDTPGSAVQLLHRDAFDVVWQTKNVGAEAIGTPWLGCNLEEEYEWRRTADYYEHNTRNGEDDDEDDGDDGSGDESMGA